MRTLLKSLTRRDNLSKMFMLLSAFIIGLLIPSRISVTVSNSLEHRIYLVSDMSDTREIKKNSYVLFTFTSKLINEGHPVNAMKIVSCVGGDTLEQRGKEFYCNGVYLGRAKDYSLKGERLDHFSYNGIIPSESLFVMGQHKDSYDSRYFGFIRKDDVRKIAYPIF